MFPVISRGITTAILTVWVISSLGFIGVRIVPGDFTSSLSQGQELSPEAINKLRESLGLNRSFLEQYLTWFGGLFRLDLGTSYASGRSIAAEVAAHLPVTMVFAGASLAVALLIAVPAALMASQWRRSALDTVIRFVAMGGMAVPSFWLGLLLVDAFAVQAQIFPAGGYVSPFVNVSEFFSHLTLPAVTMGIVLAASVARMLRTSLLEVLSQDFIVVARAKGATRFGVLMRHALPNSLVPSLTLLGLQVGYLLGGTVILEKVFSWPGLGHYLVNAVYHRDYPVVQALILIYGALFVATNAIFDVLVALVDPRVRFR